MVNHGYKIEKFILEKLNAKKTEQDIFDGENEKAIFEIKFISRGSNYARFSRKNFLIAYGYALATRKKFVIVLAYEFRDNTYRDAVKIYATSAEIFLQRIKNTHKEIIYIPFHQLQSTDLTDVILKK